MFGCYSSYVNVIIWVVVFIFLIQEMVMLLCLFNFVIYLCSVEIIILWVIIVVVGNVIY